MREPDVQGVPSGKWLLYSQKWIVLGALAAVWSGVLLEEPAGRGDIGGLGGRAHGAVDVDHLAEREAGADRRIDAAQERTGDAVGGIQGAVHEDVAVVRARVADLPM